MGTRSIRWPLAGLWVFILAACVLLVVGAYLFLQRGGRGTPRPGHAAPSVNVVAAYPGASAEEVERQVLIPLEVTFAGTSGLKSVRSKSRLGLAYLRLEFESRIDYSQARQEVINRLSVIDLPLPPGVTPQPSLSRVRDPALRPVRS
jgi:cobalt-zinc-cadmium resistance protein CzcA